MWWIDLLLLASYEDKTTHIGGKVKTIKRGQLKASLTTMMSRWECRKHDVIDYFRFLEQEAMIKRERFGNVTIITTINYEKYQQADIKKQNKGRDKGGAISDTTCGTTDDTTCVTTFGTVTNKVNTRKEVKETTDNILTHTNACARIEKDELAFVTEAKSSGEFLEQLQRQFRIYDAQRFVSLIDAFNAECKAYDKRHTSHKDFRQKFTWWVGDKLQGTFPSVQVVSSMLNAEGITPDWPLMDAYTGFYDLVRKANLTNLMYQLDMLRPRQFEQLVVQRDFSPQEVWQAAKELNNNVRYCRDHQSAYECLITFCQSNRNNPNRR